MDDAGIIALFNARDERSLEETAAAYGPWCRAIAMNLLGVREDAEECVSDALHALWRRIPPESPESLRVYLGRIVRNICGTTFFLTSPFVVSVVLASTTLPFTIYLLSSYLATLPKDYEEAAYVDGAGYFTTMVRIILPMAKPSIVTVILFEFLAYWNEYIISQTMLTDPNGARTLPVGLLNLMKAQNARAEYGQMYAGMVMVMVPTLVLYMCVQKKLTQGMTLGGLKG